MNEQRKLHTHVTNVGDYGFELLGEYRRVEEGEFFLQDTNIWVQDRGRSKTSYHILFRIGTPISGHHRAEAWRVVALQAIEIAHASPGYDV